MKFVGLISGGKDSIFNILNCIQNNHQLVCLAHLSSKSEKDSYMFQSIGSNLIKSIAECIGTDLIEREMGLSLNIEKNYEETKGDEVEELYLLLKQVLERYPDVKGVSTGAILSSYQRIRIENVCERLGLTCLSYMWMQQQSVLLKDMIELDMNAVLVKVAALGLNENHLGLSLKQVYPRLLDLNSKFGLHLCGEGGEYETIVLDCPLYKKRIEILESKVIKHSEDVWYLQVEKVRLVDKEVTEMEMRDIAIIDKTPKFEDQDLGLTSEQLSINLQKLSMTDLLVLPPLKLESPIFTSIGDYFAISGVTSSLSNLADQTKDIFTALIKTLSAHNLTVQDLLLITVHLPSMTDFTNFNKIYSSFFTINPPARVTISTSSSLQIDIIGSRLKKEHLHVKGISYWAPSNIGPYSQLVSTKHGFLAGMIGLTPASMILSNNQLLQCKESLKAIVEGFEEKLLYAVVYIIAGVDVGLVKKVWGSRVGVVRVTGLPRDARVEVQAVASEGIQAERREWDDGFVDIAKGEAMTIIHGGFKVPEEIGDQLTPDWETVLSVRVFYTAMVKDTVKDVVQIWAKKKVSITYVPVLEVDDGFDLGINIYCFKT